MFPWNKKPVVRKKTSRKPVKSGPPKPGTRAARRAFSWEVRKKLYRQLMIQVANDVPIGRSLEKFEARMRKRGRVASAEIVKTINRAMEGGADLNQAIKPWVPGQEAALIAGGVKGEDLPRALGELISIEAIRVALAKDVKSGLMAPMFTLLFGLVTVVVVVKIIVPQFGSALPRASATGLVALLYLLGDFLSGWSAAILGILIVTGIVLTVRSMSRWTGKGRIRAEKFPPWSLYRDINGYLWMTGFVSMLSAGIKETDALGLQAQYATPWLAERLKAFLRDLNAGVALPAALSAPRFNGKSFEFPSPDMTETVEELHGFADFPSRMTEVLQDWREEITEETKRVAKRLGTIGDAVSMGSMVLIGLAIISITNALMAHMNVMGG